MPCGDAKPRTLREKLAAGEFVVSVELDPPRGLNPRKAIEGAAHLKALGADCINIGDSPMARVRMSAIALAVLIEQRVGIETIIHFTSRDRNLMAIQSDLLGAHALGIRNVIALTGDPPSGGDYARATGVWDVDSIGFIRILKMLNGGTDWAGNSIGKGTDFFVACAANPTADDVDLEVDRVRRKIEAGADVLMTQQIYSAEILRELPRAAGADRDPAARRHHAAAEPPPHRVHPQRAGGRVRAGGRARAHARWPARTASPRASRRRGELLRGVPAAGAGHVPGAVVRAVRGGGRAGDAGEAAVSAHVRNVRRLTVAGPPVDATPFARLRWHGRSCGSGLPGLPAF